MRFKVGDRVQIKSLDWYNKNKSKSHGTVACGDKYFEYDMREWCGKIMTILTAYQTCYIMQEDGAKDLWTDEMIEGLAEDAGEFDPQKVKYRNTDTVEFKSKRWGDVNKSDDYQKGYQEAITKTIAWLKEHNMAQHIGILCSGVCSVNFNVDELISQFNEAMEE